MNSELSNAVVKFVGVDRSPVPGRHPDRVEPEGLREVVEHIVARLDAIRPDETASDLFGWAEREVDAVLEDFPPIDPDAREALVSLLSFTWR